MLTNSLLLCFIHVWGVLLIILCCSFRRREGASAKPYHGKTLICATLLPIKYIAPGASHRTSAASTPAPSTRGTAGSHAT